MAVDFFVSYNDDEKCLDSNEGSDIELALVMMIITWYAPTNNDDHDEKKDKRLPRDQHHCK